MEIDWTNAPWTYSAIHPMNYADGSRFVVVCRGFVPVGFIIYFRVTSLALHGTLYTWWRHQMETFSVLLAICAGNSPGSDEFPAQGLVTRSFDIFFDLRLNKRLSKQSWGWWFETPSCPLLRHCNGSRILQVKTRTAVAKYINAQNYYIWLYHVTGSIDALLTYR